MPEYKPWLRASSLSLPSALPSRWLAPVFPFEIFKYGALNSDKEIPPFEVTKGGPAEIHLKTL